MLLLVLFECPRGVPDYHTMSVRYGHTVYSIPIVKPNSSEIFDFKSMFSNITEAMQNGDDGEARKYFNVINQMVIRLYGITTKKKDFCKESSVNVDSNYA